MTHQQGPSSGAAGDRPTKAQRRVLADMAQDNHLWLDVVNDPPASIHGRTVPYATFRVMERNLWIRESSRLGRSRWYRITEFGRAALSNAEQQAGAASSEQPGDGKADGDE